MNCFFLPAFMQIKPSEMYSCAVELANKLARNHEVIQFERLHDGCVSLLRFIYLYRQRFDEMFVFFFFFHSVNLLFF